MTSRETDKVLRADPRFRRRIIAVLVVGIVAGLAAVAGGQVFLSRMRILAQHSPRDAADRVGLVFRLLTAFTALIPLGLGLYLGRMAWRGWLAGEFPPPGTRVISDTAVLTGPTARRMASITFFMAALLIASGVVLAGLAWWVASSLGMAHGG